VRIEDAYIIPRARALIAESDGSISRVAKTLARLGDVPASTLRLVLSRTRDGQVVRRRPAAWSLPWPYDLVNDCPCDELTFRRQFTGAHAAATIPPVPLPKEAFPDPPQGTRPDNVISDATGTRLGDEIAVGILEPKFENPRDVPRDLDSLVAGFQRAQAEKKLHEQSQTRAVVDLTGVRCPILTFAHSDVHWGSEDTDYDAIARHAVLAQRPYTYLFMLGDLNEFAKLKHRGAVEGQIHSPTIQARAARSWLTTVWESLLAACLGNHDMRVFQDSGFDIGEYLFEPPEGKERVPFMRDGGLVVVRHGEQVYTHNMFHGDSAFGTRFNENHKGRQTARLVDGRCDVTWNGHTHNPAVQDTSEPSDDMAGARDAVYCQAGSYKVKGDDHARRRKYLVVDNVQMPAVVTFPDVHLVVPFKRVEVACWFHEAAVKIYENGGSVRDFYGGGRDLLGVG
jgi:predicted phosphodiesterase